MLPNFRERWRVYALMILLCLVVSEITDQLMHDAPVVLEAVVLALVGAAIAAVISAHDAAIDGWLRRLMRGREVA